MRGIIDMHCHILPGVDDGADNYIESLKLLRKEYEQGVRSLILTPHYRKEYFETDRAIIREHFEELNARLPSVGIAMRLYLGCEFHRENDMLKMLSSDRAYTMAETRYVLTEFAGTDQEDIISKYVNALIAGGYRPIIAHIERYSGMRDLNKVEHLIRAGAYIQVNASSILGKEGFKQKGFCKKLLKEGFVHFIGSDAHDLRRRPPCLGECADYLEKKTGKENVRKLMINNPLKMLADELL